MTFLFLMGEGKLATANTTDLYILARHCDLTKLLDLTSRIQQGIHVAADADLQQQHTVVELQQRETALQLGVWYMVGVSLTSTTSTLGRQASCTPTTPSCPLTICSQLTPRTPFTLDFHKLLIIQGFLH